MFVEYSKIGEDCFVTDDRGNTLKKDNTDNIESIIMLENELEAADGRIKAEKKERRQFRKYRDIVILLCLVQVASSFKAVSKGRLADFAPLFYALLAVPAVTCTYVTSSITSKYTKQIKKIKLYKKALDNELNYQISRGKKTCTKINERGPILVENNPLKLTFDKYDYMHEIIEDDYLLNGEVKSSLFTKTERKILSYMMDEEMKNKNKKNLSKVKVK